MFLEIVLKKKTQLSADRLAEGKNEFVHKKVLYVSKEHNCGVSWHLDKTYGFV